MVDLEKHQTRLHYWENYLCNFEELPLQFWVILLCTKQREVPGLPDHEIFKEHEPEDCFYGYKTVHNFMRLTDEMVHTIIGLEEELVR